MQFCYTFIPLFPSPFLPLQPCGSSLPGAIISYRTQDRNGHTVTGTSNLIESFALLFALIARETDRSFDKQSQSVKCVDCFGPESLLRVPSSKIAQKALFGYQAHKITQKAVFGYQAHKTQYTRLYWYIIQRHQSKHKSM